MGGSELIAGRYQPIRKLGSGGMGSVWLCNDLERQGQAVALKIVEAEQESAFRAEYSTHASLHHPNLAEAFDFHPLADGRYAYALEFIDGVNCARAIEVASGTTVVDIALELLAGISFLHSFNLIHRDLKPENVLTRRSASAGGVVALIDLGLATGRKSTDAELAGTVAYMAPELFDGEAPSVRTDLFAVGTIILEGLLGKHPIAADPSDLQSYLSALRAREINLDALDPSHSEIGEWACSLAHPDPSRRPSDAREAIESLCQLAMQRRSVATIEQLRPRLRSGKPVARDATLNAIRDALKRPETRLVILTGGEGAGKSRLIEWVKLEAVRYRWNISDTTSDLLPETDSHLIVIDDAHALSAESVERIDNIARAEDVAVAKTLLALNPQQIQSAQLDRLLSDAKVSDGIVEVVLPNFTLPDLEQLLSHATLDGEIEADELLAVTGGHARTTIEVLESGERDLARAVSQIDSNYRVEIGRLDDEVRTLLLALSVAEAPLNADLLSDVFNLDSSDLYEMLMHLQAVRLVVVSGQKNSIASQVISRIAIAMSDEAERATIAADLLSGFSRSGRHRGQTVTIARLAGTARQAETAIRYALAAAEEAEASQQWNAASVAYRIAICSLPRRDPRYHELRLAHANANDGTDDLHGSYKSYVAAIRTAPDSGNVAELCSLAARAAGRAGLRSVAKIQGARAVQFVHDDRSKGFAALAAESAHFVNVELNDVVTSGELAVKLLSKAGEPREAEARYLLGAARTRLGDLNAGRVELERAAALAESVGDRITQANALFMTVRVLKASSNYDEALERLSLVQSLTSTPDLRRYQFWCAAGAADIYQTQGRYDRALKERDRSAAVSKRLGLVENLGTELLARAELLGRLGRPATGGALAESILRSPSRLYGDHVRYFARLSVLDSKIALEDEATSISLFGELGDAPQSRIAASARLMLTHEANARFDLEPAVEALTALKELDADQHANTELLARCWIAWSATELHRGDWRLALDAAVRARDLLKGTHHDLAAQVYLAMSRAHAKRGAKNEAEIALARGREELDAAAVLIEDGEYRNDFLARPVFRELRAKRHTFADAEDRLSALYEMSASLNSAHHPEDQLGVILDQALRAVRAERGLILLRSPGTEEYRVRVSRNLEEETEREAAEFSRTAVLAAEKGDPVISINASDDERLKGMHSVSRFGIRSILCVPLRVRNETVGAVYADSRNDGAIFNPEDLRFLSAFANHAALALENAREMRELEVRRDRLLQAADERTCFGRIIGRSPSMQSVYTMVERVAGTHLPVLIHGASGTGKELIAREIVERSPRAGKPFLTENCAAIAETLLESELFGHVKGAFTGADADKPGLFEQADGGTLFLDEVGDMSPAMQARLLRVLQEGEIRRVGDESRRKVDVRVITASHRNLPQRVVSGEFREDLLHRLQVLVIDLPALCDRPLDVALLVDHFLERIAKERRQPKVKIRTAALERFERYSWPGNVRQLENTLQRLSLLAEDGVITMQTIEHDPTLRDALLGKSGQAVLSLKANEEHQLREALDQSGGNRVAAAKLLGVSRATIFRKIKQYDL